MPEKAELLEKARQFLAMAESARDPVLHYALLELAAHYVQFAAELERKDITPHSE
jgi:hypothetical protein